MEKIFELYDQTKEETFIGHDVVARQIIDLSSILNLNLRKSS